MINVIIIVLLIVIFCSLLDMYSIKPFVKMFRLKNFLDKEHVRLGDFSNKVKDISTREEIIKIKKYPDCKVYFYSPSYEFDKLPLIMFIHGGGWVGGSAKKIEAFCKLMASYGYVVANVDYSLAPEHRYPVSTHQLMSVLNHIYENSNEYKIDKHKIFVGGTSAGAHLASQIGALVSNKEYAEEMKLEVSVPKITGLLLINGVYEFETVLDCKFPMMRHFLRAYISPKKWEEASSLNYITKAYPSVFITVGDKDPLEGQSLKLIDKLKEKEVDYQRKFFKDANLFHDFIYLLDNEHSKKTFERMMKYIKDHC